MPCVKFQRKIPASERAKTVHILDRAATVIKGEALVFNAMKVYEGVEM
jgi:hypothetical protein